MHQLVDLHTHIVPEIDDGSRSIEESVELLKLLQSQDVTDVFCTSHSGCLVDNPDVIEKYFKNLDELKKAANSAGINVRIHKGCEVLCSRATINNVLHHLEAGSFATLGETNYVLAELYPDLSLDEALFIINELKKNGYKPIIAHMERIYSLTGTTIGTLIENGALIQVNVQNFVDGNDSSMRDRARQLLKNKYVHFIGSDGHRIDQRRPELIPGVEYILENTDTDYAEEILTKNPYTLINN